MNYELGIRNLPTLMEVRQVMNEEWAMRNYSLKKEVYDLRHGVAAYFNPMATPWVEGTTRNQRVLKGQLKITCPFRAQDARIHAVTRGVALGLK
jgi:hypothetical protein